jgi:DNA polymerase III delta subunit
LHIKNLLDHNKNFLIESLTATSFFSEKKFIIIDIDLDTKDAKNTDLLEFIIKNA